MQKLIRKIRALPVSYFSCSFTVEAAFICPIVLVTVFTLLCHAFRLHDRVLERTALSLELSEAAADPSDLSGAAIASDTEGRQERILDARIYEKKNQIVIERGAVSISGSIGDYKESRPLLKPEDILRARAALH